MGVFIRRLILHSDASFRVAVFQALEALSL